MPPSVHQSPQSNSEPSIPPFKHHQPPPFHDIMLQGTSKQTALRCTESRHFPHLCSHRRSYSGLWADPNLWVRWGLDLPTMQNTFTESGGTEIPAGNQVMSALSSESIRSRFSIFSFAFSPLFWFWLGRGCERMTDRKACRHVGGQEECQP
jgi:hypothetical protein